MSLVLVQLQTGLEANRILLQSVSPRPHKPAKPKKKKKVLTHIHTHSHTLTYTHTDTHSRSQSVSACDSRAFLCRLRHLANHLSVIKSKLTHRGHWGLVQFYYPRRFMVVLAHSHTHKHTAHTLTHTHTHTHTRQEDSAR